MTKTELRQEFIARQKLLSSAERSEMSAKICERFFAEFDLTARRTLHLFLSIKKTNEIETAFILNRLKKDFADIKIILPRVNYETMTLDNILFDAKTKFVLSRWQVSEPANGLIVDEKEIDIVLVPLVAFDKSGFRVGYGKGFYDKFLIKCRPDCLKIGLSYFPPVDKITDIENFDVKLDFCLTPDDVWRFQ